MKIEEVKALFEDKENTPCPLTEKLVKAGYQQIRGGYIDRAHWRGVRVNYKENSPSQYWHLMTYCARRNADYPFSKSISCGELLFWMAEVSGSVEKSKLEALANQIIESADLSRGKRPVYDRMKWNRVIQKMCFDKIAEIFADKKIPLVVIDYAVSKGYNHVRYVTRYEGIDYYELVIVKKLETTVPRKKGLPVLVHVKDEKVERASRNLTLEIWTMGAPYEETIIMNRAKVEKK